ncbi:MAG: SGNH/GDSL hydrolase family protein [Planctomycetota bacterium]
MAAALGVAEYWVRNHWPAAGRVLVLDDEFLFVPKPYAGHVQYMQEHVGGGKIVVQLHADGMRSPIPIPRTHARAGSSSGFVRDGGQRALRAHLPARLQALTDDRVEVLSAGVSGYGPDQTWMRTQQLLPKWKPEAAILVICAVNDFGDPVRNNLMRLDADGVLHRQKATPGPQDREWFLQRQEESRRSGLARLWLAWHQWRALEVPKHPDQTLLADYMRAEREDYEAHISGSTVANALLRDIYDADVAIHPEWPSSQYKLRLAEAILAGIRDLCAEQGVPLAVVVVPGAPDADPDYWLRPDPGRYPGWQPERLTSEWQGICERVGVPVLNLYGTLKDAGHRVFVGALDPHWNGAGMDLGARTALPFLESQGWSLGR